MKRFYINTILACSFVACALTACTDVWDEHYQTNPTLSGEENLWELISAYPGLEDFAALLEATGYDSLLAKNRSYTVWAPTQMPKDFDIALLNNDSALKVYRKEIVENHIADFSHVAGGIRDKEDKKTYSKIQMLNGKAYDFAGTISDGYKFANNSLVSSNKVAKNGVLHVMDGYARFAANIWEQLSKERRVGELFAFLEKDYKREFNPYASTPGPIVDGQPTYLDSAFTESCRWFNEIGQLNREDSLYTMYALTDKAWRDLIEMTKDYFVYEPGLKTLPEYGELSAAQVTDSIVKELSCRNLVFSQSVNKRYFQGETDTLISNYQYVYPRQMFVGEEASALRNGIVEEYPSLSNGDLYIVDEVNYNPFTCWFDTIRFEGESLSATWNEAVTVVQNANAKRTGIDKDSVLYDYISNGAVGVITPKEEKDVPVLNFYVDNILSGYYKISIVLLRPNVVNPADTTFIKPNKFNARLYYADGTNSGVLGVKKDTNSDPSIVAGTKQNFVSFDEKADPLSLPNQPDTIVLAECIKVPYCEYNSKKLTGKPRLTRLELTTEITFGAYNAAAARFDNRGDKNQGRWKYDNSYRIDQVIFEPIPAPAK